MTNKNTVIYRDENFEIELSDRADGIVVFIHRVENDKVWLPGGYVLGENCIIAKKKDKKGNK